MTAKIIKIDRAPFTAKKAHRHPKVGADWLQTWLKEKGLASDARAVWDAWPPLESASLKLARLFGEDLKAHDGSSIVGSVVSQALLSFRSKKATGAPIDRAAKNYIESLLECGELIVSNRVEAGAPDGKGALSVWDPSVGRYDEWCAMQPAHYVISSHSIRAEEGEYAAGRSMIAALILSPAEYSRLVYTPRVSGWGPL